MVGVDVHPLQVRAPADGPVIVNAKSDPRSPVTSVGNRCPLVHFRECVLQAPMMHRSKAGGVAVFGIFDTAHAAAG